MAKPEPGGKKPIRKINAYVRYSGLGFQVIVLVALGAYAGVKLDDRVGEEGDFPIFTVSLTVLALIASMYFLFKEALRK